MLAGNDLRSMTAETKEMLTNGEVLAGFSGSAKLGDLWEHKDIGRAEDTYTIEVPKHGVVLLKVSR